MAAQVELPIYFTVFHSTQRNHFQDSLLEYTTVWTGVTMEEKTAQNYRKALKTFSALRCFKAEYACGPFYKTLVPTPDDALNNPSLFAAMHSTWKDAMHYVDLEHIYQKPTKKWPFKPLTPQFDFAKANLWAKYVLSEHHGCFPVSWIPTSDKFFDFGTLAYEVQQFLAMNLLFV